MKTINNILAIASIALSLTACSSDNESTSNNEGKEYPISLSVGIGDLSVVTRAAQPLEPGNNSLGLYITKNGDKSQIGKYLCNNEEFKYTDTWSSTNTYYWASDNTSIDYVAYFPYNTTGLTPKTNNETGATYYTIDWNVAPTQTTGEGSTSISSDDTDPDLLWQTASASNTSAKSVDITLGHACSKLTVNVSKLGSEIESPEANPVTVSKIEINGMAAKGTFNFTTAGEWSDLGDATSYAMKSASTTAGNKATYEAILIPQAAAATLMITLSNNATYQLSIPSQAYEMRKHYTITIQVGQDKVGLGEITQEQWTDASLTDDQKNLVAQ